MSVEPGVSNQFSFVGGLNTEGGVFTQPPNTWKEGQNVIPQIDGTLKRRYAIDIEKGFVATGPTLSVAEMQNEAASTFVVKGAKNTIDRNYIVLQKGAELIFYDAAEENGNTSDGSFEDPVTHVNVGLNTMASTTEVLANNVCQYAQVNGSLVVVNPAMVPIAVDFDNVSLGTTVFSQCQIRDFKGIADGEGITNRPVTLSNEHKYNLENQGWTTAHISTYQGATGQYPSNAQAWIYGKDATDTFSASLLDKQDFGTSLAPKGRKILNLITRLRELDDGTDVSTTSETTHFSTVASFAGRVWFSGLRSAEYGNAVFFGQVSDEKADWVKFYQRSDPTSEVFSDLADDDGGVIQIRDCGNIVKLVPIFTGMLVFADNGVWFIRGTSTAAFSAASYEVLKVSEEGTLSPQAVVAIENAVLYFARGGINVLTTDAGADIISTSLTDLSIKTFFNNIPAIFRNTTQGVYNPDSKLVTWLFGRTNKYTKDEVLVFDTRLKCFYTHSFNAGAEPSGTLPFTQSLVVTEPYSKWTVAKSGVRTLKFFAWQQTSLISGVYALKIADMEGRVNFLNPSAWQDWTIANNNGPTGLGGAFVLTGHDFGPTHPSARKHALYIVTHMKNTEDTFLGLDSNGEVFNKSSCTLTTRWDFSNNSSSGKEPAGFEIYRWPRPIVAPNEPPYELVVSKNKIRGRGRALDLKFTSATDKDMRLAGWSILWVGNTNA